MPEKKIVFETPWFNIEAVENKEDVTAEGRPLYRVNTQDGVLMIVVTKEEKLILVQQFRPAVNQYTLEFPAGQIEEGETPEIAAARELNEETGYICESMRVIGKGFPMANRVNAEDIIVFGKNAVQRKDFVKKEKIETLIKSPEEIKKLALMREFSFLPGMGALVIALWKVPYEELPKEFKKIFE